MGKKIFISHSTVDKELVGIITEFLNHLGICNNEIFCTTISGTLAGGQSFVEQIKDNVQGSKVVIFVLTERFFLSHFCIAELGAAWAANSNILPILVPPISLVEYNNTPLIGVQALNAGSTNFANEFYADLIRMDAIMPCEDINTDALLYDLNSKIKIEMNILRKDSKGFYVARLLEEETFRAQKVIPKIQSQAEQFILGKQNTMLYQNEFLWKLNGILDLETDSRISEHWIAVGTAQLICAKFQFEIDKLVEQKGTKKFFSIKQAYTLP